MTIAQRTASAIREKLSHPIIDADGHIVELTPLFLDYLRATGGGDWAARWEKQRQPGQWFKMSPEQRRAGWAHIPQWWGQPTLNALDRATGSIPKLLYARMDEIGLDYSVLYPTVGLILPKIADDELRCVLCRAINGYNIDQFQDLSDRMTIAAIIPMHTPEEAIAELDHAVNELGFKAVMMAGHVQRAIPRVAERNPEATGFATRLDFFGLDSDHDYDPVWAKCGELKVAPGFHFGSMGWGSRRSISNYMYNHIGHFAAAGEAICKALFMGGVTRRFPELRFAFLEGGVWWACSLFADLIGHWEKRNPRALENYNPANLDLDRVMDAVRRYGDERMLKDLEKVRQAFVSYTVHPEVTDDWSRCGITSAQDIYDLFVPKFFFGCEADDPLNAWAFNAKVNPFGARLQAMLSSDIGHWDVPDVLHVVPEAYKLAEKGLLSEEDFGDFAFRNAVKLWGHGNPAFFKGTRVETAVADVLAQGGA